MIKPIYRYNPVNPYSTRKTFKSTLLAKFYLVIIAWFLVILFVNFYVNKDEDPQRNQALIPWEYHGMGINPARDKLVEWWNHHPEANIGLSCCNPLSGPCIEYPLTTTATTNKEGNSSSSLRAVGKIKTAAIGITDALRGMEFSPPVFRSRIPIVDVQSHRDNADNKRRQVAYVVPFVEFQLPKIISLLFDHWFQYPPCNKDTEQQDADLVFFTEHLLSPRAQKKITRFYLLLGPEKIGCFHSKIPTFLTLGRDVNLSHVEGAAYSFYRIFEFLEPNYKTFLLAEPDVTPIQSNWLPALVQKSAIVGCNNDQYWQIGSPPLSMDLDSLSGKLLQRLDYHMNGNSIYALGCVGFEDYKCRVQTFYIPQGDCTQVAGCKTPDPFEGGYDHALYRFRVHSDNYQYARRILNKFSYSPFILNYGKAFYTPQEVAQESPTTYFVHSNAIFLTPAATILNRVSSFFAGRPTCDPPSRIHWGSLHQLQKLHRRVRSGEFTQADVIYALCKESISPFHSKIHNILCNLAKQEWDRQKEWKARLPRKTYIWNIDMYDGPTNCDIPMIVEAGGVVYAEVDGMCDFYGFCKEQLNPSNELRVDFYNAYKNDPKFQQVDAFLCHHPVANCGVFTQFHKPIIVHATTRLEFGHDNEGISWRLESGYNKEQAKKEWAEWIHTLKELAKDKHNIITANNVYDQHYIKYVTGIEDVDLIPSWCGEAIGVRFCNPGWESTVAYCSWHPTKPEIVIVPYRSNFDSTWYKTGRIGKPEEHPIIAELRESPNGTNVVTMQEMYDNGNPLNLLEHPAVVIIPSQVSRIQLVELYRLNIPMFCPSLKLLKKWYQMHDLIWEAQYRWPKDLMPDSHLTIPNPNGRLDMNKSSQEWNEMFDYWMPKNDFYMYPHIHYFDSWDHFWEIYNSVAANSGLEETHIKMMQENQMVYTSLLEKWEGVLSQVTAPVY